MTTVDSCNTAGSDAEQLDENPHTRGASRAAVMMKTWCHVIG
jgi:hypothetical protein